MGDINMRATDNAVKEITGKDLPRGILPGKAVVKFKKDYSGGKRNAGSVVMMLAKGEDKSVQSVCFYTAPWQIGKKIVEALDEVAKVKGFEGNMKKRHPGLEWIGIDKSRLTEDCDYIEKMGWVATPDSCHGAANLVNLVKKLSAELLTSHLPCDYYLGEIIVPEREKTKYQVILDGKLCVLLTRHHCIHLTKTLSNCLHARTLARSHARTLARSHTHTSMHAPRRHRHHPGGQRRRRIAGNRRGRLPLEHAPWRLGTMPLATCVCVMRESGAQRAPV